MSTLLLSADFAIVALILAFIFVALRSKTSDDPNLAVEKDVLYEVHEESNYEAEISAPIPTNVLPTTYVAYGPSCKLRGVGFGSIPRSAIRPRKRSFHRDTFLLIKFLFNYCKKSFCASEVTSDLSTTSTMDYLDETEGVITLIESFGYSLNRNSDEQGEVDHTNKTVNYMGGNSFVTLAVLTHELVHILEHEGLVSHKDIPTIQNLIPKDGTHLYDEAMTKSIHFDWVYGVDASEDLAYSLMTYPIAVMSWAEGLIPSSTTGDVVTTQRVEDAISPVVLSQSDLATQHPSIAQFEAFSVEEKSAALMGLMADPNLFQSDVLWLQGEPIEMSSIVNPYHRGTTTSANFDEACVSYGILRTFLSKGLTPFPYWLGDQYDKIVFIGNISASNGDFKEAIQYSPLAPKCRAASPKITWVFGKKVVSLEENDSYVQDADDMAKDPDLQSIAPYKESEKVEGERVLYISADPKMAKESFDGQPVHSSEWMFAVSLLRLLEKLTVEETVDFISCFEAATKHSSTQVQIGKSGTGQMIGYHEVLFNFETLQIEGARSFAVRHLGYLQGHGKFDARVFMALIAMELVAFKSSVSQSTIDGTLAFLTQLWEEEDNYGQIMDFNQQLRVIRENTMAILRIPFPGEFRNVMEERSLAKNGKFPYFRLWNNNTKDGVSECTSWCRDNKIGYMVDKNAMKRVVIGAGVSALWMYMDFETGVVRTIMDIAKPGKALNRGWNSVSISAMQGFDWQVGYQAYEAAKLGILHSDENGDLEIVVKGDRKMTLTTNASFLVNGSGVGNSNAIFAYAVPVRVRGTFNLINMKAGEKAEHVAAEIEMALVEEFSVATRMAATTKKRVLFRFRGAEILSFGGINQDIAIDPEQADIKVRCLATSSSIEISATIFYTASDAEVKGRGQGIKASLVEAKASNFTICEDGNPIQWDVHLNSECLKGNSARLSQWAESTGEKCLMNLATQSVTVGNRVVDLTDENSEFYVWWRENTKTYVLEDTVDFYYLSYVALSHAGLGGYIVDKQAKHILWPIVDGTPTVDWDMLWMAIEARQSIKVVGVSDAASLQAVVEAGNFQTVRVQETVQGVLAPFVFQVELASVRECSSKSQSNTLQQLMSVYLGNPELAYALMDGSEEVEQAVMGVAASALNDPGLLDLDNVKALSQLGANWEDYSQYRITPKEMAERLNPATFGISRPRIYTDISIDPFKKFNAEVPTKFNAKIIANEVGISETIAGKLYNFLEVQEGTSWNYQVNVGTGYNMGSVALLKATLHRFAHIKAKKMGNADLAAKEFNKLAVAMRVAYMCWIVTYEDAWLAGYSAAGMALGQLLHDARKGSTMQGKTVVATRLQNIDKVVEALREITGGEEGIEFSRTHVDEYINCFQIARAISHVERYDQGDGESVIRSFGFGDNDLKLVALAGAFRRCDQGRYANYLDPVDEGNGPGTSVWNLLASMWYEVQEDLPFFLRRKIYKAMEANLQMAGTKKSLRDIMNPETGTADTLKYVTTLGAGHEAVAVVSLKDDGSRPILDAEECSGVFQYILRASHIEMVEGKFVPVIDPKHNRTKSVNNAKGVEHWGFDEVIYTPKPQVRQAESILALAHNDFPEGVIITCGDVKTSNGDDFGVFLHFGSILRAGAIMTGGSSTGVSLRLATFLVAISRQVKDRPQKKFTQYCRNNIAAIGGQLRGLLGGGLMRRIARVAPNTQGAKVRTSHNCPDMIVGNLSIPTVRMNPNDSLVKCGKYEDKCFVSVGRTPQLAEIYAILVLDETVAVGFVVVNAVLWSMANGGDGDGDGITIKNLSELVNNKIDKQLTK